MFGDKELRREYQVEILFKVFSENEKVYKELFKLKQKLDQYNKDSQEFIITSLIHFYIQKNMKDAAKNELNYLKNINDGFWESDILLLDKLEKEILELT